MLMLVISRGEARVVEHSISIVPTSVILECICMATADAQLSEMDGNECGVSSEGLLTKSKFTE